MAIQQAAANDIQHNYQREIIQKRAPRQFGKTSQDQDISAEPPKPTVAVQLGWLGAVPGNNDWQSNFNTLFRLSPEWRHYYYTTLLCQYGFFKGAYHNTLEEIVQLDVGDTLKLQSAPPKAQNHGVKNFIMDKPQVTLADVVIPDQLIPEAKTVTEEQTNAGNAKQWAKVASTYAKYTPDQLLPVKESINANDKTYGAILMTKSLNQDYLALKDGYVYVFKGTSESQMTLDQEYWLEDSMLYPVDLTQLAGTDNRPFTRNTKPTLLLEPGFYYQIAVSHWQWSWARINYFGGIDPAFKNLSGAAKDAIAQQNKTTVAPASGSTAQNNRLLRFGKALSITQAMTNTQRRNPIVEQPSTISPQLACVQDGQPLVWFVDDPIRMALEINNDLIAAHSSLLSMLAGISERPYSDSALVAYQSFFNPAVAKYGFSQAVYNSFATSSALATATSAQAAPDMYLNRVKKLADNIPNQYAAATEKINQNTVREVLSVDMRRQIRYQMRWLQSVLVQLFMQKADNSKGMVSIHEALKDGFSASDLHYGDAFGAINALFARLPFDPSCFDEKFDIIPDEVLDKKSNIPSQLLVWPIGSRYLNTLGKPAHPLNKCLFPQVTVTNNGEQLQYQVIENDGTGQFRIHAFRANYYGPDAYAQLLKILGESRAQDDRTDVPLFDEAFETSFGQEGFKTPKGAIKAFMLPNAFNDTALGVYVFDQIIAGFIMLINHATRVNSPDSNQLLTMTEMLDVERTPTKTNLLYLVKATNDGIFVSLNTADIATQHKLTYTQLLGEIPHWRMQNFGYPKDWQQPLTPNEQQIVASEQYRSIIKDQNGNTSYHYSAIKDLGITDLKSAQNAYGSMVPKTQLIPLDYRQHEHLITFSSLTYDFNHMYKPQDEVLTDAINNPAILKETLQKVRRVNQMLMTKKGCGPIFAAFQLFNLIDSIEMLHNDMVSKQDKHRHQHEMEDWLRIAMITQDMIAVTTECLEDWGSVAPYRDWTVANHYLPHKNLLQKLAATTKQKPFPHETEAAFGKMKPEIQDRYFMCRQHLVGSVSRLWNSYLKYMGRAGTAAIAAFSVCDLMNSHNLNDFIGNSLSTAASVAQTAEMLVNVMDRKKEQLENPSIPAKSQTESFSDEASQQTTDFGGEAENQVSKNSIRSSFKRTLDPLIKMTGLDGGFEGAIWIFPRAIIVCIPIVGELATIGSIAWGVVNAIIKSEEYYGIDGWAAFGPFGKDSASILGPHLKENIPANQTWYLNHEQWQQVCIKAPISTPTHSKLSLDQTQHSQYLGYEWGKTPHGPTDCYASLMGTLGNPTIDISDNTLPNGHPVKEVSVYIGAADIATSNTAVCLKSQWQVYQAQAPAPINPNNPTILGIPYAIFDGADTKTQLLNVVQIRDSEIPHSIVEVMYVINNAWKTGNTDGMWQTQGTFKAQLWAACQVKEGSYNVTLPSLTVDDQLNHWDGNDTAPTKTQPLGCPPNKIYAQDNTGQSIKWVRALPSPPLADMIIVSNYQ